MYIVLMQLITYMTIIDNAPNAIKEKYFRMKRERANKVELKVVGGNYYLYATRGV